MSHTSSMKKQNGQSPYRNKRVLVTGADGFIGSHLAARLVHVGANVSASVHSAKDNWRLASVEEQIQVHAGDLSDKDTARRILKTSKPEIVFNVAGSVNTKRDLSVMDDVLLNTYGLTHATLLASLEAGVENFVQFGTYEEYGAAKAPFAESAHEEAVSPYSLGKLMSTNEVRVVARLKGIRATIVRPAATFGPMQGFGMLIPNLIQSGLRGSDFDMNGGEQIRDFVYINDLVDGVILAGAAEGAAGEIVNLGGNRGIRIRDVAEMVNEAMGNPITIHFGALPYRDSGSVEFYMDSTKAKKILGWSAKTPLKDAINETVAWYREHLNEMLS